MLAQRPIRFALALALASTGGVLVSCDPEDVRDVNEVGRDAERQVEEIGEDVEEGIDQLDTDGKDD